MPDVMPRLEIEASRPPGVSMMAVSEAEVSMLAADLIRSHPFTAASTMWGLTFHCHRMTCLGYNPSINVVRDFPEALCPQNSPVVPVTVNYIALSLGNDRALTTPFSSPDRSKR